MKKIVSMALIAALIVSAAGCGEKAPAETTAKTEAATETVKETTAKETAADAAGENSAEETAETTAEAEVTTTTAPEETSEYAGLSMSNPISFDNGSLYFEASNDTKYLYQVAENKIYEINDDWTHSNSKLFKTGESKTIGNVGDWVDYKTGMITVEADGEWYFINLSDPDTLLNPFELVQG